MANGFDHIFLHDSAQTSPYTSPSKGGREARIPCRDRIEHSTRLREELLLAWREAEEMAQQRAAESLPVKEGTYLEFSGSPGFDLKTTSLEDRRRGVDIRLLNVSAEAAGEQAEAGLTRATVYVPKGKIQRYLDKIERYRDEDGEGGKPKNQAFTAFVWRRWTPSGGTICTSCPVTNLRGAKSGCEATETRAMSCSEKSVLSSTLMLAAMSYASPREPWSWRVQAALSCSNSLTRVPILRSSGVRKSPPASSAR